MVLFNCCFVQQQRKPQWDFASILQFQVESAVVEPTDDGVAFGVLNQLQLSHIFGEREVKKRFSGPAILENIAVPQGWKKEATKLNKKHIFAYLILASDFFLIALDQHRQEQC